MLQVWVVHRLQIIGEAARSISPALRVAHPGIPEEVWSTAVNDLPLLRPEVEAMLAELS